jgi:hypothetical protein
MTKKDEKCAEANRLILSVKKAISREKKSSAFVGYYEAEGLADDLDQIRQDIMFLTKKFPDDTKKLMLDLLKTQGKIFERSDDSNGFIGGVFRQCVEDLGEIFSKISVDVEEVVNLVYRHFIDNEYGVEDNIIFAFKDVLKDEGLNLLKKKFVESVTPEELEKVRLEAAAEFDGDNDDDEGDEEDRLDNIKMHEEFYISNVRRGLTSIADCRNDVDEYIQACSFEEKIHEYDYMRIAKRLINHRRCNEALEWLDKMTKPVTGSWKEEHTRLKIDALSLSGNEEAARQERVSWFYSCFAYDLYEEILKYADDDFGKQFREQAIEKAFEYSNIYGAMNFLAALGEIGKLSQLIRINADAIDGGFYYALRPIAKILRETDRLAATIVYRKLLEHTLGKADSKYYQYAAKDLIACCELSLKIKDFDIYGNHDNYFANIQTKHKKKYAFWRIFNPLYEKGSRLD